MADDVKKLFLVDAYALIFRAYFAFARNPRITSTGLDTSAIFGFTTALLEVIQKERPTHIGVAFDTAKPTQRHIDYEAYKAHRQETPEAIKLAVPYILKVLEALRIPILLKDGFEADDVIGTLAKQAEEQGFETYMMTPDKDFGQLVTEKTKMYKPGRGGEPAEVWGPAEVCARFGLQRVDQVIDLLGMMGDSADNIPGLPGVGEKTAVKLLEQYGTLEETLAHAHEIKGKLGEKIKENAALGILSKQLATIITDVPIELDPKALEYETPDAEAVTRVFSELEFRTLLKRVLGDASAPSAAPMAAAEASPAVAAAAQMDLFGGAADPALVDAGGQPFQTIQTTDHHYQVLETDDEVGWLVPRLLKQPRVCFDTETTSLDVLSAELVGLAISFAAGKAYYIPFSEDRSATLRRLNLLKPLWESTSITKVGQNLKYDLQILAGYGIQVAGPLFDTMLAHYVLEPDLRHNMDYLAETYLKYRPVPIEELMGKGRAQTMRQVPLESIKEYAGEDADVTLQLAQYFDPLLDDSGARKVLETIEMPLVPVLAAMEREGVNLDVTALKAFSQELQTELVQMEEEIRQMAGFDVNVSSPRQLGEVLFERLKLVDKPKKTKTGQYATGEEVLAELKDKHPIVGKILDFREVAKLKSTYVDALPALIHPTTGRIHTSFNQAVAATGRLSSNNPNLQNIPIRTDRGKRVRAAFIARDADHLLISADYSQIELRLIAELSGDSAMTAAFLAGEDIHAATAAKVFGVPLAEVTKQQRSHAKTVNFGIIYGVSAFGLSQQTNLSKGEAAEIIASYFKTYPGIKDYIDAQVDRARSLGYVETLLGRRRYLRDINSRNPVVRGHAERNAVNAPIQGSAADIIKLAMVQVQQKLQEGGYAGKMILQVHDELVFDVPRSEVEALRPLIAHTMQHAVETKIPLLAETGVGSHWLDAH
jgi:DNA polymerase-1